MEDLEEPMVSEGTHMLTATATAAAPAAADDDKNWQNWQTPTSQKWQNWQAPSEPPQLARLQ
eukprot:3697470-Prorocentrum_lima.AAC.1